MTKHPKSDWNLSVYVNEAYSNVEFDNFRALGHKIEADNEQERSTGRLSRKVDAFFAEVTGARQVPQEFVVAPLLCALSAVCGSKVTVRTRGYVNRTNLWATVIAPSGSNKSRPAVDCFQPILDINAELYTAYLARMDEARDKAPKGDKTQAAAAVPRQQIIISDTTPEARNQAIRDNPHGMLLYTDELATMIANIERYGGPGDFAQLMTIYDGGDLQINRKGEPMALVKSPFLSIFGTMQDDVFREKMCADKLMSNGFTQRFLCFCPAEVETASYLSQRDPSADAVAAWTALLRAIYQTPTAIELTLTPRAEAAYATMHDALGYVATTRDLPPHVSSALNKMRVMLIKIAALAAMTHYGDDDFDGRVHFGDVKWARSVVNMAIDAFSNLSTTDEMEVILSRREAFRQAAYHFPQLLDETIMTDILELRRSTARDWIRLFKQDDGEAD